MIKNAAEAGFLEKLFAALNSAGIRYAVLRNYEKLPRSADGGDLDILIHPDDLQNSLELVSLAIEQAGGAAIGITRSPGFHQILAFGHTPTNTPVWWGLCLDIFDEVWYRGAVPLMSPSIWVDGCESKREIRVLKPGLAALLGVLKELLYNGKMTPRYREQALNAFNVHQVDIEHWLAPLGGPGLIQLRDIILRNADPTSTAVAARHFRRHLIHRSLCDSPVKHLRKSLAFFWSRVERVWKPAGMVVAMLGTDGVGKSTTISAIGPILSAATHSSLLVKHLRPGLLPPLARIKGRQAVQVGPVTNPHGSKPSGLFGSLVRIVYLTVDYILGYWLVVWPKIAKVPAAVVLFDRYAYDIALDPKRFRIGLPSKLIVWFTRLAPRPDIIFCLYASPAVIAARKQELPLEEVMRQVAALRVFAAGEPRAVLISTERSMEETRDQVLLALRDHCAHRTGIGLPSE